MARLFIDRPILSIVIAIVIANLVNLALNWVFIFGHFGFAPRGVVGSAMATRSDHDVWAAAGRGAEAAAKVKASAAVNWMVLMESPLRTRRAVAMPVSRTRLTLRATR